ncbi:hypothetical protein BCR41DRAFT_361953, partial [Lobosporangium transversale]
MCFSSLVYFHSLFLGVPFSFLFLFLLLVTCRFSSLPYFLLPYFLLPLAAYRSWGLFCFSRGGGWRGGEIKRWRS